MQTSNRSKRRTLRPLARFTLGATIMLALFLAGVALRPRSFAAQTKPAAISINIDNFSFTPMKIEIPAGTQVTWINKDDVPHTVVSDDHQLFKSRALDTDEKFSFTFETAGTFQYFCSVHPKMIGMIVVK